jgi:UDP-glucose 4-epimerase
VKILIPGVAGAIARKVALRLKDEGHEVVGLDRRPWPDAPIEVHEVDIRKRAAEDVFRKVRPDVMVHMATVTSLVVPGEERYQINLGGTRAVFEYAHQYGVQHCVFVGRHTFYGAGPDSPLFHKEDEPPLELNRFPELADLVAADLYAAAALWRVPDMTTTVLRMCYTLGPSSHGTLGGFLRGKRVPTVLGFDPLFQFLHEEDVVRAIVLTVEKRPRGVFNVAGPQPLPLVRVIREAGRTPVPLPEFVLSGMLGRFGFPQLPTGAVTHLKYPVVVDAGAFRETTGFAHAHDELETIRAFREAVPPPL